MSDLWLKGKQGYLAPWSEAKAWALREVWQEEHGERTYGMLEFVAKRIEKEGGGSPSPQAVQKLFSKMDDDPSWYPGKQCGPRAAVGRPQALSAQNKAAIARSAMQLKKKGLEPTFSLVVAQCPKATLNPTTGVTVDKKRVYDAMRELCYDVDPNRRWTHRPRVSKSALTEDDERKRLQFGHYVQGLGHTDHFYFWWAVWTDICNSILPRSTKRAAQQALARKAGKGWGSEGSQMRRQNMRGSNTALKQASWDSVRYWFAPVLLRGKVHVELLGCDFPGESPEGAAVLVKRVRSAINIRCQGGDQPKTVMVDRCKGFYTTGQGKITKEYADALKQNGLKAFMGADASEQPGSLQELMLHETVMAWVRRRLALTCPKKPWEESVEAYEKRLRETFAYINDNYDVDSLSRAFPKRIKSLIDSEGGKLKQ